MRFSIFLPIAAVFALPDPLVARDATGCSTLTSIVTLMQAEAEATPFCSSLIKLSPVTSTTTTTFTPEVSTKTKTTVVTSTTTTSILYFEQSRVVQTYVATETTVSTCSYSARAFKRAATSTITTPSDLSRFPSTAVKSACSCLNLPTSTVVLTKSTTAPAKTVTTTLTNQVVKTVTSEFTTFYNTYTVYTAQYTHTSTFTFMPYPTETIKTLDNINDFEVWREIDFTGYDIANFYCYPGGPSPPAPFNSTCNNFADCVNQCAYADPLVKDPPGGYPYCSGVVYNVAPDGSSASCYLKRACAGCGIPKANTTAAQRFPLRAYDTHGPNGGIPGISN